jgi:hypothetical protein
MFRLLEDKFTEGIETGDTEEGGVSSEGDEDDYGAFSFEFGVGVYFGCGVVLDVFRGGLGRSGTIDPVCEL